MTIFVHDLCACSPNRIAPMTPIPCPRYTLGRFYPLPQPVHEHVWRHQGSEAGQKQGYCCFRCFCLCLFMFYMYFMLVCFLCVFLVEASRKRVWGSRHPDVEAPTIGRSGLAGRASNQLNDLHFEKSLETKNDTWSGNGEIIEWNKYAQSTY